MVGTGPAAFFAINDSIPASAAEKALSELAESSEVRVWVIDLATTDKLTDKTVTIISTTISKICPFCNSCICTILHIHGNNLKNTCQLRSSIILHNNTTLKWKCEIS